MDAMRFLSATSSLIAVIALAPLAGHSWLPGAFLAPAAMVLASILICRPGGLAQATSRAIWWACSVAGVFFAFCGGPSDKEPATIIAIGASTALLLLGRRLLVSQPGPVPPSAFREEFAIAFLLGTAELGTLLFVDALYLSRFISTEHHYAGQELLVASTAVIALAVALLGISRSSVWGAVAAVATHAILPLLAIAEFLPPFLAPAFTATAIVQLALFATVTFRLRSGSLPTSRSSAWTIAPVVATSLCLAAGLVSLAQMALA